MHVAASQEVNPRLSIEAQKRAHKQQLKRHTITTTDADGLTLILVSRRWLLSSLLLFPLDPNVFSLLITATGVTEWARLARFLFTRAYVCLNLPHV